MPGGLLRLPGEHLQRLLVGGVVLSLGLAGAWANRAADALLGAPALAPGTPSSCDSGYV